MSRKKPRPQPRPAEPVPGLTDSHTHLASVGATTPGEVRAVMDRARAAGVERVCTVGDDLAECRAAAAAAEADPGVYCAVAIHPTRAGELDGAAKAELRELASRPRCVAVGETGIDGYWLEHEPETTAPMAVQKESFAWHVDLACELGKPVMIHNREGDEEVFEVLDAAKERPREVILHCFSSPLETAKEALERGYVLSFSGNVTFKRNEELREAARIAPVEQLLVETDAPFLTAEPYRGGKNEPALVGHQLRCVAEVRGEDPEVLAAGVARTFDRVYGLGE